MIRVNGELQNFIAATVSNLLIEMGIETRGIAVALNGEIVSRSEWSSTLINDNDSIEVVTAAAGG